MRIKKQDMVTRGNKKYITLETTVYEGVEYAFVNELDDKEEVTDNLYIFTVKDGYDITIVEDNELINKLLVIFNDLIEKDIKDIMNSSENGGNGNE